MEQFPENVVEKNESLSERKEQIVESIRKELESIPQIEAARLYGSWLHKEDSIDLDIGVIVPSERGVVCSPLYEKLRELRHRLTAHTEQDVDLVPHTRDEISDFRSPLYHPRYNPSLVSGRDLKGRLDIRSASKMNQTFDFGDLAANTLLDNRTICRRQLVRSLRPEEGRIFVSKLLHGPGNALTLRACKKRIPYLISPSDRFEALVQFDEVFHTDSQAALPFLRSCEKSVDIQDAAKLLGWYEHLVAAVLYDDVPGYDQFCFELQS